ncbi:MAG: adenosylcobinamide-GDP ribazoletransferase [Paracoccus sp. (in: a-proteobacteria)]|nr:adenosylcobinamide-GDP ribazoletransferase [Paracoccus sp. (in: a-proteobacteria)]
MQQLVLALVFLSRLPLAGLLPARPLSLAAASWAFPLAGAIIGAIAGLPLAISQPGLLPAALSLTVLAWLTGGLHEDAMADFADAGGGKSREDRLRIMREPVIGSYGTISLLACWSMRLAALAQLGFAALIAAVALSRMAAPLLMAWLPPARPDGLGQGAGRPTARTLLLGTVLALGIALALLPVSCVAVLALASLAAILAVGRRAMRLIGGQTGDVLGAAILAAETAGLVALAIIAA